MDIYKKYMHHFKTSSENGETCINAYTKFVQNDTQEKTTYNIYKHITTFLTSILIFKF